MRYYAHTKPGCPETEWEDLYAHLRLTADYSRTFASSFAADAWGHAVGLWHDIGKATDAYLHYFRTGKYQGYRDHSTAGAQFAHSQLPSDAGKVVANCIAGHHCGLTDEGPDYMDGTLLCRLNRKVNQPQLSDDLTVSGVDQLPILKPGLRLHPKLPSRVSDNFSKALLTRMLFSCLIDADRQATARFTDGIVQIPISLDYDVLIKTLDTFVTNLPADAAPEVNDVRSQVRTECQKAADLVPGFFTLTAPTGGGKTLSSLEFALRHAKKHNKRRIIYVVPYITITDQITRQFEKVFGPGIVVEHHSNINEENMHSSREMRLSVENWNAQIIVTTSVQFFESLFAYRPNRCRKLHNIINSVIVLDEAQMLPVPLLQPCLAALRELTINYSCSVVLCTATQPAVEFDEKNFFIGLNDLREIIPQRVAHFQKLERVKIKNIGYINMEGLVDSVNQHQSFLCIVSTRRQARDLYYRLPPGDDLFHLSTFKCGKHRSDVIGIVRSRLNNGLPCRVVSTSLVEAGIDVDFPVVYRGYAGVDSIAQAAGRCNRHGKLGHQGGSVYIFNLDNSNAIQQNELKTAIQVTKQLLGRDLLSIQTVSDYFQRFYRQRSHVWDQHNIIRDSGLQKLRTVGLNFKMIEDNRQLLVPYENGAELIDSLKNGPPSAELRQRLQRYTVPIYPNQFSQLLRAGIIRIMHGDEETGIAVLVEQSGIYNLQVGLEPW